MGGWLDLDMVRYLSLLLFIVLAWSQVEENIVVDISYYENGQKKHQRPYSNSIADGKWTHWYANGQKWTEGTYKDGLLVDKWDTWYISGQKWIEGSHKNNKRNGKWTFYNEDGTVYEIKEY